MNTEIEQAIQDKAILSVSYNGGKRIIEPHCYGRGKSGKELLRCYQSSGFSTSNEPKGWKLMHVDAMRDITPTGDFPSAPRPGYNPLGDKAIPTIYMKL